MSNEADTTIDNVAEAMKPSQSKAVTTEALQELKDVDSSASYEKLCADSAAIAAKGGLPGMLYTLDENGDGKFNDDDLTNTSVLRYISDGDGLIDFTNEKERRRMESAARDGVILDDNGNVVRQLTFEERMGVITLLNNFKQIEATGGDDDMRLGYDDLNDVIGDNRTAYQENLYGIEAALTSFAPDGTKDSAEFQNIFKTDNVDLSTLTAMANDPAKYGLNERQFRGIQAMINDFANICGNDGLISTEELVDYGKALGMDLSNGEDKSLMLSNQQAADDASNDWENAVGESTDAGDAGSSGDNTDNEAGNDDGDGQKGGAKLPASVEHEMMIQGLFRKNEDGVNLYTLLKGADNEGDGIDSGDAQSLLDRANSNDLKLDQEQRRTLNSLITQFHLSKPGSPYEDGKVTYAELAAGTMYESRTEGDLNNSTEFQPLTADELSGWMSSLFSKGDKGLSIYDALTLVPEGDPARDKFNLSDIDRVLKNPSLYGISDDQVASLQDLRNRFPQFDADHNGVVTLAELQNGMPEVKTADELTEEFNIDPDQLKNMMSEDYRFLKRAAGDDGILLPDDIDEALADLPADSSDPDVQRQREILEYTKAHYDQMAGKDGILTLDEMAEAAHLDRNSLEAKIEKEDKVARRILKGLMMDDAAVWTEISKGKSVSEDRLEKVINDPDSSAEARKYAAKLLRYFEEISPDGSPINEDDLAAYALNHDVSEKQIEKYRDTQRENDGSKDDSHGDNSGENGSHGTYAPSSGTIYDNAVSILKLQGIDAPTDAQVYKEIGRMLDRTDGPNIDLGADGVLSRTEWEAYCANSDNLNAVLEWWQNQIGKEIAY